MLGTCAALVVQMDRSGLDVLIDAEKIVRVELALDSGKTFVVVTICGFGAEVALFFEVVYVNRAARMRLHGAKELLDPANRLAGFAFQFPVGMYPILEPGAAKAERVIVLSR